MSDRKERVLVRIETDQENDQKMKERERIKDVDYPTRSRPIRSRTNQSWKIFWYYSAKKYSFPVN